MRWVDEAEPPTPQGVVGQAALAHQLLDCLQQRLAQAPLPALRMAAGPNLLVLTGPVAQLPWLDGLQYIAPRAQAPALWLPCTRRPAPPLDLLERALLRAHRRSPLLVLESGDLLAMTQLQAVSAISLAAVGAYWHD